ncbi:MAG: hypothetical protein SVM86_00975 [Candidatus Cloacimonadota bacterium]|nr:hypothetical protein [Candidatus Cloacimonadota bacterium]
MKKLVLLLTIIVSVSLFASWEIEADANLNLTQSAYSDNWEGSEVSNITWNFQTNLLA